MTKPGVTKYSSCGKYETGRNSLNGKASVRIAVLCNSNSKDILSQKIYFRLKREYTAFFLPLSHKNEREYTIENENLWSAFLTYYRINYLVIPSSVLGHLSNVGDAGFFLLKIFAECIDRHIKIIYLRSAFCIQSRNTVLDIIDEENSSYSQIASQLESNVLNADGLVIKFSVTYGYEINSDEKDFIQHIKDLNKKIYLDSQTLIFPILVDELVNYMCEHINDQGRMNLYNYASKTTFYDWAISIVDKEHKWKIGRLPDGSAKQDVLWLDKSEDLAVDYGFSGLAAGSRIEEAQRNCSFNLIYQLSPYAVFKGEAVASKRFLLGEILAKQIPAEAVVNADYVVPVPRTGLYYAMGVSYGLRIPYLQALTKDDTDIRTFQILDTNVRKEIIKSKIFPIGDMLYDKNIILVDEAVFTGTTLKVVCRTLKQYGVRTIHLAIPTPKCRNQCPYYIQPKREMLLEYIREDMLGEYFDADTITFQDDDLFLDEMKKMGNLCYRCFLEERI